MNLGKITCILLSLLFLNACSEQSTPKPAGYPYIKRLSADYKQYETDNFSILVSGAAIVKPMDLKKQANRTWFNISYSQYKATIYCSYLPITKNTLREALDDSHQLAYTHTAKADEIQQSLYTDDERNIGGMIYDIRGHVAVPIQFFVTDSTSHFFRGSVYYDEKVNPDSVAPVTEYLREDIVKMIETLEWKK